MYNEEENEIDENESCDEPDCEYCAQADAYFEDNNEEEEETMSFSDQCGNPDCGVCGTPEPAYEPKKPGFFKRLFAPRTSLSVGGISVSYNYGQVSISGSKKALVTALLLDGLTWAAVGAAAYALLS